MLPVLRKAGEGDPTIQTYPAAFEDRPNDLYSALVNR
jgi:hypothetical protein